MQGGTEVNTRAYDYRDGDPHEGTNTATRISIKGQHQISLFLALIDTFQFAPGLSGLSQKGKTQYCCIFCPLFRTQHSIFYELPAISQD